MDERTTKSADAIVETKGLSFRYGTRLVLQSLDFQVQRGEITALLGPNGSGKSTLFRLLSTLVPLQQGSARVCGFDVRNESNEVRASLGVVFQSPALDRKLTVAENLRFQAALYGLPREVFVPRIEALLTQFGVWERRHDLVEILSGGLRRRVELAKGMLHAPELLLMDEPSTGLDPSARRELWNQLEYLCHHEEVTVLLTTHLLDEADQADRVAILHEGKLIADGSPDALRASVGGYSIEIESEAPVELARQITEQWAISARVIDRTVRLEIADAADKVSQLMAAFPSQIRAIRVSQPTLEDVFIAKTGHHMQGSGISFMSANTGSAASEHIPPT